MVYSELRHTTNVFFPVLWEMAQVKIRDTRPAIGEYQLSPPTANPFDHLLIYNRHPNPNHLSVPGRKPTFYRWLWHGVVGGDILHVIGVALMRIRTPIHFPV